MADNVEQDSSLYYDRELFTQRVELVMHQAKLDWDGLALKFKNEGARRYGSAPPADAPRCRTPAARRLSATGAGKGV